LRLFVIIAGDDNNPQAGHQQSLIIWRSHAALRAVRVARENDQCLNR